MPIYTRSVLNYRPDPKYAKDNASLLYDFSAPSNAFFRFCPFITKEDADIPMSVF